jgi:hypothetical protein
MNLKEAAEKIAALEKRIADLEKRPQTVNHHHNYREPSFVGVPRPDTTPYFGDWPLQTGPMCGSVGDSTAPRTLTDGKGGFVSFRQ